MLALLHAACASRLPIPERARGRTESYVEVPFPPPPPRPEHVPRKPHADAVWVDGEWDWDGARYRWVRGAWVVPPDGAKISPWSLARREDGTLFYAPSVWTDADGRTIPQPAALARGYVRERADGGAGEIATPGASDAAAGAAASAAADAAPPEPQEQRREAEP